ncbi:MAG TPA: hypothetical protein VGJ05_16325 [Fimbriiglobus sp.]|jgi:hypothetical protein
MLWIFKSRWTALLAVVGTPVVAFAAAPESTTAFVFDLWHAPQHDRAVAEYREAMDRMSREMLDIEDRIAIKERIVADLISQRISFDVAVQQFVALNSGFPNAYAQILNDVEGATDAEKAAYSLLNYVSQRGIPVGCALPRLAAAYEARFGRTYPGK